jgi:iron complex outermembrane receptor protein
MTHSKLRDAIRLALLPTAFAGLAAPGLVSAQEADAEETTTLDQIEVTGSRIKRADIEGALPVTVITRQQLDVSGDISVSEYLRDTTFNSFGSFRPQSGSAAQAAAQVSLRGLGASRTLVLIDGRRAPVSPATGSGQDLNSIPLAAVERIEILSDGASAIYGSDAIGGVINIITRKDFNGVQLSVGSSNPKRDGGETEEGSVIFGISGERGSLLAGASFSNRGIVFARDREWSRTGASTYSNNFTNPDGTFFTAPSGPTAGTSVVPGGCAEPAFSVVGNRCFYDFGLVAADEAEIRQDGFFARGSYDISDNWTMYMNTSVNRVFSFGRYAPSLAEAFVPAASPNNPFGQDLFVRHRFASLGTRDDTVDSNAYDLLLGLQGRMGVVDLDVGMRRNEFKAFTTGRNYVVIPIAEQYIADGTYDIFNPSGNSATTLNAMKATIGRESATLNEEIFAVASMDMFELPGGTSSIAVGAEYRSEDYYDQYDSLSEAGVIGGSAGNSAAGGRKIRAAYFEALFPIWSSFEATLAGRYDKYSDYGADFSPKVAFRWQPLDSLTIRGSYGEGFAAPPIPILSAQPSSSADFVTDPQTCVAFGLTSQCTDPVTGDTVTPQVTAWTIANPSLESETSKQLSLGVAWDATEWLNLSLDYYRIEIDNLIAAISTDTIIACLDDPTLGGCPPGLSTLPTTTSTGLPVSQAVPNPQLGLGLARDPATGLILYVQRGFANQGDLETSGYDLNVRTNFELGNAGTLRNQLQVSWVKEYSFNGGDNLVGIERTPEFRASLQNIYSVGDFSFAWNINHIDSTGSRNALRATPDPALSLTLPSWTTHDLQISWNAPWNGIFVVGVNNIADKDPVLDPLDPTGRGYDFNLYDGYGRVPYVRYTQSF